MSDNQKIQDYAQQFKTELEQALTCGDFSGLNQLVQDTVGQAVAGAAEQVSKAAQAAQAAQEKSAATQQKSAVQQKSVAQERSAAAQKSAARQNQQKSTAQQTRSKYDFRTESTGARGAAVHTTAHDARSKYDFRTERTTARRPVLLKKTGNVAGTLFQVFGGIGTGMFGIPALVFIILYIVMHSGSMLGLAVLFLMLAAGSVVMLGSGGRIKERLARAHRYLELCGKNGYINIDQIAQQMGRKEKAVVKELKKLIGNGTFPQGHLDRQQKCFMLTDQAYEEYQTVYNRQQEYLAQSGASGGNDTQDASSRGSGAKQAQEKAAKEKELTPQQKQLAEVIEEGQTYIRQIREKNDAIPGEVISQKLWRMESLLQEIFDNLEKMPEQLPKMQRLMHYYLPTTLKLVTAYEQFDSMSVQGEEVLDAKKEIENTIDTINDAFGELLNKLFADTAMDVTTDAQVLKTMLAKEGLVEGEL